MELDKSKLIDLVKQASDLFQQYYWDRVRVPNSNHITFIRMMNADQYASSFPKQKSYDDR